jgi:branched-chain amino acid transport system substrate-binding protein
MRRQITLFALVAVLCGGLRGAEPVYFGVSGPLTGPNSQYGAQWKKGFDLALEQINSHGGVRGRPLQYIF